MDSQTAFVIVSIDIADIDVGANIGARLQLVQAEADIRIARANAEQRRPMAVAREQEMIALTREHQAAVVLVEAQIPKAIAEAFRAGQLRAKRQFGRHQEPTTKSPQPAIRRARTPTASVALTQHRSLGNRWRRLRRHEMTGDRLTLDDTVTITVNTVNDAPVATDDSATTDEEQAVTIDVLANDTDVDGDTLTVTSVSNATGVPPFF